MPNDVCIQYLTILWTNIDHHWIKAPLLSTCLLYMTVNQCPGVAQYTAGPGLSCAMRHTLRVSSDMQTYAWHWHAHTHAHDACTHTHTHTHKHTLWHMAHTHTHTCTHTTQCRQWVPPKVYNTITDAMSLYDHVPVGLAASLITWFTTVALRATMAERKRQVYCPHCKASVSS